MTIYASDFRESKEPSQELSYNEFSSTLVKLSFWHHVNRAVIFVRCVWDGVNISKIELSGGHSLFNAWKGEELLLPPTFVSMTFEEASI